MKPAVSTAIEEIKKQFPDSTCTARDDGQGGAYIVLDAVDFGERYTPRQSWMGFHIVAQYPYADIYPVFIGGDIQRSNGQGFVAPVTPGFSFEGRPAFQVSRRSSAAAAGSGQRAVTKVLKILSFLEELK
ncbi:MAG TPA: hypothetical protein VJ654_00775 [Noviherbaspirillum sp.]|nr:hypothetical protein [Noviherbaspirillum sp.]